MIPDDDLLAETYRAFHRSEQLRERFEEMEEEFDEEADAIKIPRGLKKRVRAILAKHDDLRWDDAVRLVLDETQLDRVREEKQKAKKKSGDFTGVGEGGRFEVGEGGTDMSTREACPWPCIGPKRHVCESRSGRRGLFRVLPDGLAKARAAPGTSRARISHKVEPQ